MTKSGKQFSDSAHLPTRDRLPRQFAPLLFDEWYAIAASRDVDRTLKGITVVGEPLVYYRTQANEPVVLSDRCAHRFYPLSKSHLEGDSIRCGYHGFKYGSDGKCTSIPGSPARPQFGVRRYPAVELGPWLWVWMGDAADADPGHIPLVDPPVDWNGTDGYIFNECNYMLVIENLLDLSHLHFLHGAHVVDESFSVAPPKPLDIEGGVGTIKMVESTRAGLTAVICGEDPERRVRRVEENRFPAPSLADTRVSLSPIERDAEPVRPGKMRILHALTPRDLFTTHQFWSLAVDAPLAISPDDLRRSTEDDVFSQDLEAVAWQMESIMSDHSDKLVEHRSAGDRFAVRMHRILIERGEAEAATRAAST